MAHLFNQRDMQTFKITPVICSIITMAPTVKPVSRLDLQKYSGKWYVISAIPTRFDKDWDYTTETYTIRKDGNIDIYTTYIKKGQSERNNIRSKGFPIDDENNMKWKVQFIWPFKADYLVEEIANDYSYVVVGHPKKKFLYIMNRSGKMNNEQYSSLVEAAVKKVTTPQK
jgi:apolipoprotein D and lipocalin family protein